MSARRGRSALLAPSAAALAAACTIVNGLEVPREAGAPDAADAGAETEPDLCRHAYPPERRDASDSRDSILLTVVANEVSFADPKPLDDSGAPAGFDLDRRCSCPAAESCVPPTERDGALSCDDEQGRDNVVRDFVLLVKNGFGFDFDRNAKESADQGKSGLLFSVLDYNGQADDPLVRVATLVSPGLFAEQPDGGGSDVFVAPTYTTNDRWATRSGEAVFIGSAAGTRPIQLIDGYVRDFTLVVPSIDVQLRLRAGMTMRIAESVLVARLVQVSPGEFTIDRGTVSGRWLVEDAYRMFGSVERDPVGSGKFLCNEPATMATLRQFACKGVDLAASARLDNTGAPCRAGSVTFSFRAAPATLGPPRDVPSYDPCSFGADGGLSCSP